MQKIYIKIFIGIIILLWIIYFVQIYIASYKNKKETFVPRLNSLCRPYIRKANIEYENFINNYGPNVIMTKLKKWNIY